MRAVPLSRAPTSGGKPETRRMETVIYVRDFEMTCSAVKCGSKPWVSTLLAELLSHMNNYERCMQTVTETFFDQSFKTFSFVIRNFLFEISLSKFLLPTD